MTKRDIKNILMSMRNPENEAIINNFLGKIDIMAEQELQKYLEKIGNNEESIRNFFESKISEKLRSQSEKKFPINDMFTYGIAENCIHLYLTEDFDEMLRKEGPFRTIDIINLYLFDAIDRIKQSRDDGDYRVQGKDSIYMISPILIEREMKFLDSMNFKTHLYRKKDLNDDKFIEKYPEAKLATQIFGKDKNIGTASIDFATIASEKWQNKKKQIVKEFEKRGITLLEDAHIYS